MHIIFLFSMLCNFIFTNDLFVQLIDKSEDLQKIRSMTKKESAKQAINTITESFYQMTQGKKSLLLNNISINQLDSFFGNLQRNRQNELLLSSLVSNNLPLLRQMNNSLMTSFQSLDASKQIKLQETIEQIFEIAHLNPILISDHEASIQAQIAQSKKLINSYEIHMPLIQKQQELAERTFALTKLEMNEKQELVKTIKKNNRFNWIYCPTFLSSTAYFGWLGWTNSFSFSNSITSPLNIAFFGAGMVSGVLLKSNFNKLNCEEANFASSVLNKMQAQICRNNLNEKLKTINSDLIKEKQLLKDLENTAKPLNTPYSQLLKNLKLNNEELPFQANVERFKNQAAIIYFLHKLAHINLTNNAQVDCGLLVSAIQEFDNNLKKIDYR